MRLAESYGYFELGGPGDSARQDGECAEPRDVQEDVHYLVERDRLHEVADGESAWHRVPLRGCRERHDSIFVPQTDDDTHKIGEILALDSAELHVFEQVMIQEIFPAGHGHASLFLRRDIAGPSAPGEGIFQSMPRLPEGQGIWEIAVRKINLATV